MAKYEKQWLEEKITVNIGEMAKQAEGSVFCTFGNTDFLVTVTTKKNNGERDFFPLVINFEEKYYSMGKIPGNFGRREAKPSDWATLKARMIDRPIRPLFPKEFNDEVQIVITLLGYDKDFEIDMLSIFASSIALRLAKLPLEQLVSGIIIGKKDGKIILNPNLEERENLDCELKAAGTSEALNMIEFEGNEISEEEVLEMLDIAHEEIKKLNTMQEEVLSDLDVTYEEFIPSVNQEYEEIKRKVTNEINLYNEIYDMYKLIQDRHERNIKKEELTRRVNEFVQNNDVEDENVDKYSNNIIEEFVSEVFIDLITKEKYRVDGRGLDEIRQLDSRVNLIKQAHGSALFTRGETQSLAITTLGIKNDEQLLDGLEDENNKSFMLHYNFPPYSVGETGRMGTPGRREIGHGNLAEKALKRMIPNQEEFPYTIRLVSEILESNGSSSQASICAGTMSLLAAGVPIKKPVAGIAMGLIKKEEDFAILTDIAGLEDHLGDMDFKVAGTSDGITAIQMDIKIKGISRDIFKECLAKAKKGRLTLLEHINSTIDKPLPLSCNTPKIEKIKILKDQIKTVIGRGGETINKIIEETDVKIDIDEEGVVLIYSQNQENAQKAKNIILDLTKILEVNDQFDGVITRIESYGMFVKLTSKHDGLLHVSDLNLNKEEKIEDKYKLNQNLKVKVKSIDEKGRIKVALNES